MCGISGFVDFNKICTEQDLIKMTDALSHRGPDAAGYKLIQKDNYTLGLGHRRLSIIDLSACANQPFTYKNWQIIFNGEIYNFQEIKVVLEKLGRVFNTASDTEVLIQAFDEWGEAALEKLIGFFVFAAFNNDTGILYIVRDRVAVKPLYYYWNENLFLFASELKAFNSNRFFKKELNPSAIAEYLELGYIQTPNCIFNHTHKLPAASLLTFNLSKQNFSINKYWAVDDFYKLPKIKISEEDAIIETDRLLVSAFNYRLVSDVPVGVFLSGGLDSSLVTAILQKESNVTLNTITIGFNEEKYDESGYAKKIANYLGTNHTEYHCTQKDALEIIPTLPFVYDEPFGDSSSIPTILVSKLAAKSVKVVLSADGGDELFAGYGDYVSIMERSEKFLKIPKGIKKIASAVSQVGNTDIINNYAPVKNFETIRNKFSKLLESENIYESGIIFSQVFTEKEVLKLMKSTALDFNFKPVPQLFDDTLSNLLSKDFNSYLPDDILVKVDRATMSVSIEGREPFLDHRLIQFVAQLPSDLKIKGKEKKYLLRKILNNYLPHELTDRPKMGFGIPVTKWLNDELKEIVFTYLNEEKIKKQKIFNWEIIENLLNNFYSRNNINERKIWYLLVFQLWYEKWIGF